MIIGVDIGGTKTLVARFDDAGAIIAEKRFPTPLDEMTFVREAIAAIETMAETRPIRTITLALPGIIIDNVLLRCGNLPWKNFNIAQLMRRHFPATNILLENDAKLGGIGEVCLRGLKEADSVLYITISTGIGTAVISGGTISPGMELSEAGHMMLEYDGQLRDWEDFASGRAFHEIYGKFGSEVSDPGIWHDFADRVSRGLLALIPTIQPSAIIIGGSMGEHYEKYEVALDAYLTERLPAFISKPPVVAALHPDEAVIHGCYYYAVNR